jgi:hypothetical protein
MSTVKGFPLAWRSGWTRRVQTFIMNGGRRSGGQVTRDGTLVQQWRRGRQQLYNSQQTRMRVRTGDWRILDWRVQSKMPQYLHAVLWHPMLLVTFSLHGVDRANIGSEVNSLVVYCEYCFTVVCLLHRNRLLHRLKHQQMVGGLQAKICFIDLSL